MLRFPWYDLCLTTYVGYSKGDPCRDLALLTYVGELIHLISMSSTIVAC